MHDEKGRMSNLGGELGGTREHDSSLKSLGGGLLDRRIVPPEDEALQALMNGLAAAGIGLAVLGPDYRILRVNSLLAEAFGDLSGQPCYAGFRGLQKACDGCTARVAFDDGMVGRGEVVTVKGKRFEVVSAPFVTSGGRVTRVLQAFREMSSQAQSEDRRRVHEEELSFVLATFESLSRSLELDHVCQTLTDTAARLIPGGSSAVYLCDGDGIYFAATNPPLPPDFPEHLRRPPLETHPHIARALDTGSPVMVSDVSVEEWTPAEREIVEMRGIKNVVYNPVIGSQGTIGVHIMASTEVSGEIAEAQLTLCRTVGKYAAIAIENARLYQSSLDELAERRKAEREQKRLRDQLAQAQKMEAVGRLAGGIAHDFNNVLCAISGQADLLLRNLPADAPLRESLTTIARASERGADLTRQLLAFSRKQVIDPKVVELSAVIKGLHSMLTRLIGEDVILDTMTQKSQGRVKMDPGQIEQIVLNLAVNARDAMPDGGRLLIETADVVLDDAYCESHADAVPGEHVMLGVSDTGIGMSEAVRSRVFEPFFTTKQLGQGTGLGLATVHGIVQQNDGYIEVDSAPGQGTAFKIYFRRVTEGDDEEVPRPQRGLSRGTETVLLVEDEELVRDVAEQMLRRCGYTVLVAGSGQGALALARDHEGPIDLLLTDVVMPLMNGQELAEKVATVRPGIKILYVSGYTEDVIAHHGVIDEGVQFISKPYTFSSLSACVRAVLDSD